LGFSRSRCRQGTLWPNTSAVASPPRRRPIRDSTDVVYPSRGDRHHEAEPHRNVQTYAVVRTAIKVQVSEPGSRGPSRTVSDLRLIEDIRAMDEEPTWHGVAVVTLPDKYKEPLVAIVITGNPRPVLPAFY
jgi:hypothetical protein